MVFFFSFHYKHTRLFALKKKLSSSFKFPLAILLFILSVLLFSLDFNLIFGHFHCNIIHVNNEYYKLYNVHLILLAHTSCSWTWSYNIYKIFLLVVILVHAHQTYILVQCTFSYRCIQPNRILSKVKWK